MTDTEKLAHIENSYRALAAQVAKERTTFAERATEIKVLYPINEYIRS